MSRKKVAFFGPQYGIGGAGRVCAAVGKALAKKKYDVDFLVDGSYSEDSYLEEGLPDNCRVVPLTEAEYSGFGYNPVGFLGLLFCLLNYLTKENIDVLISNLTKFNVISAYASVAQNSAGVILVEQNLLRTNLTKRNRIIPYLVQVHYPLADKVLAVSSDVREDLCENHGISENKCRMIPNPLDVEDVVSKSVHNVDHRWFQEDIPVILGVGRFVEQKQFSLLLEAFELLTRDREIRLVLAGDGPLMEDLRKLTTELEIDGQVDFLGFVSNPYKYMRRAELLAISSKYEGFGVVVTEALACGTPVVSTNCPGGPSDILGNGEYGELVNVGAPNELAEAMARTLNNPPTRDRLINRARFYDVDRVVDRYASLIDKVIR